MGMLKTLTAGLFTMVVAVGALAAFGSGEAIAADRIVSDSEIAPVVEFGAIERGGDRSCVDQTLTAPFINDYDADQLALGNKGDSRRPAVWCEQICEIQCGWVWTGLTWVWGCFIVNCQEYCPPW